MSPYQITGTYIGALTSSAGLAAATESSEAESRQSATNFQDLNEKTKTKILAIINNAKERDARHQNYRQSAESHLYLQFFYIYL